MLLQDKDSLSIRWYRSVLPLSLCFALSLRLWWDADKNTYLNACILSFAWNYMKYLFIFEAIWGEKTNIQYVT